MAGNYGFINMDIKMRRFRAEGDWVIKSAYCSCRNPDSVPIIHIKCLTATLTLVSGYMMPSDFNWPLHTCGAYIHAGKQTYT